MSSEEHVSTNYEDVSKWAAYGLMSVGATWMYGLIFICI